MIDSVTKKPRAVARTKKELPWTPGSKELWARSSLKRRAFQVVEVAAKPTKLRFVQLQVNYIFDFLKVNRN